MVTPMAMLMDMPNCLQVECDDQMEHMHIYSHLLYSTHFTFLEFLHMSIFFTSHPYRRRCHPQFDPSLFNLKSQGIVEAVNVFKCLLLNHSTGLQIDSFTHLPASLDPPSSEDGHEVRLQNCRSVLQLRTTLLFPYNLSMAPRSRSPPLQKADVDAGFVLWLSDTAARDFPAAFGQSKLGPGAPNHPVLVIDTLGPEHEFVWIMIVKLNSLVLVCRLED
jgi:hypothetical protein